MPQNPVTNSGAQNTDSPLPSARGDGSAPSTSSGSTPTAVPAPRQRDPPIFSGAGTQDVEDWLNSYERVSTYNRWDDTTKLANVVFYFEDLARTWFDNHEAEFATWSGFRDRLRELFGKPTVRKANATRKLSARYQRPGESYAAYIEDVLALCNRSDPNMSEPDKIAHITKGIAEEAFQYLLLKDPSTVAEIAHACRTIQEKRNTRLLQASPSPAGFYPAPDVDTLRSMVRELVREELSNMTLRQPSGTNDAGTLDTEAPTRTIQALIQEEVTTALHSDCLRTPRQTYADVLRTPAPVSPQPPILPAPPSPLPPLAPLYPRPPDGFYRRREPRTCFYCGIQGHIARFCRRRQQDFGRSPQYGYSFRDAPPLRAPQHADHEYTPYPADRYNSRRSSPTPPARRRSVSPYRGRSPTRNTLRPRTPSPQENP